MTTPRQARTPRNDDGPRTYAWPPLPPHEFEVVSVTSAKDNWPKPWLVPWAAKMTAERAVDDYAWLGQKIEKEGDKEAIKWLKNARFDSSGEKADRGTVVHAAIEAYLAGKELTNEQFEDELRERRIPQKLWRGTAGMVAGVMQFLDDVEPEVVWSEQTVYSRTHGYAGTPDIVGRAVVGGSLIPVIVDIKTSKSIYDDTSLQLAGYGYSDFVGLDDGTEAELLPGHSGPITHGIVVNPKANGTYDRGDFTLGPDVFDAFLACLAVTKAQLTGAVTRSRRP
jgi:hypothetical protein